MANDGTHRNSGIILVSQAVPSDYNSRYSRDNYNQNLSLQYLLDEYECVKLSS